MLMPNAGAPVPLPLQAISTRLPVSMLTLATVAR